MKRQWTKKEAWDWYNSLSWIRGFNGYPSNCVNRIAMWQNYNHEEVAKQIEYEFSLAANTGFNAVRAIIQFECWYYEHDSFMNNLEEYFSLADKYGLKVMLTIGNDCSVPKEVFEKVSFGPQKVDWGHHGGKKINPHEGIYDAPGYYLMDEEEFEPYYYKMVDELGSKYAKDPRLQVWDIFNEPGNGRRGNLSLKAMEKFFEIIRSHDSIAPLTADVWSYDKDLLPRLEIEKRALELSDIITFHYYGSFENMKKIVDNLRKIYDRPLINNEWLNRCSHNNVLDIFPYFYEEKIGSYHWGLIQGYSQTYEPWGRYFHLKDKSNLDLTKWQHDLYRFNGYPYDEKEIECIKYYCLKADQDFKAR